MTVIGTTVTKKKDIAANAQGPPVALNMTSVVQLGLRFLGERLTIKDLQGTMITGAEAMMTADRLIIILTAAGTIRTDAETTEDATTKTSALMRGGTLMERDGRVKWYLFSMVETDGRLAYWFISLIRSLWCCRLHGPCTSDGSIVGQHPPKTRKEHLHLIFRGPFGDCASVLKGKGYFFPWLVSSFWLDESHTLKKDQCHSLSKVGSESTIQPNSNLLVIVHGLFIY